MKSLIALDFDNTLFYNPDNDFSNSALRTKNLLKKHELESITGIKLIGNIKYLITGRLRSQEKLVLDLLEEYNLDYWLFNGDKIVYPKFNPNLDLKKFMQNYLLWKTNIINSLNLYCKSNRLKLIVIDDNRDIIDFCKGKNIDHYHLDLTEVYIRRI